MMIPTALLGIFLYGCNRNAAEHKKLSEGPPDAGGMFVEEKYFGAMSCVLLACGLPGCCALADLCRPSKPPLSGGGFDTRAKWVPTTTTNIVLQGGHDMSRQAPLPQHQQQFPQYLQQQQQQQQQHQQQQHQHQPYIQEGRTRNPTLDAYQPPIVQAQPAAQPPQAAL